MDTEIYNALPNTQNCLKLPLVPLVTLPDDQSSHVKPLNLPGFWQGKNECYYVRGNCDRGNIALKRDIPVELRSNHLWDTRLPHRNGPSVRCNAFARIDELPGREGSAQQTIRASETRAAIDESIHLDLSLGLV